MIGLYPLTGQTTFLILAPWFESMALSLPSGGELEITTTGGDRNSAFYVQSLKIDGQPWDKSWVTWDDIFAKGAKMEYILGEDPVHWATGQLPPSPASG